MTAVARAVTRRRLESVQRRRVVIEKHLRVHYPALRRGESLFAEWDSHDFGAIGHRNYTRVLRELSALQNQLRGGTKFEKLVRYRCANLFFLVLPNELFRPAEVPLGWGALVEGDGALTIGAQTRLARNAGRRSDCDSSIALRSRERGRSTENWESRSRRYWPRAANSAFRFRRKKIVAGHFLRLRQAEQKQQRRRDVGQDSIFNAKICRVIRDVNEMDQVRGVSGVRRSIGIAHLLAIAVIGRDQSIFRLTTRVRAQSARDNSSMVSTALIPAATTPVCPTMSGLAKFRMIRS